MTNKEKNTMQRSRRRASKNKTSSSSQQSLVAGSTWMSIGSMVSKLLGALYIIPWMAWMGDQATANAANALFTIAYQPYGLFLAVATAGIPSAISQQVSYFNSLGEYEISKNIYKRALQLMALSGLLAGILMHVFAPYLSARSPNASLVDGIVVIRSLVPALVIIPVMSVTRGFLQGHHTMVPSAISQIIEQLTRVLFMLSSVYLIRQVQGGSVLTAVSMSTFAAFVGAIFSLIYLFVQLVKRPTALNRGVEESANRIDISTRQLIRSIIATAIPFVIISIGISISLQIDQYTYAPIMEAQSTLSDMEIQISYGVSHANANKLIMILISFGASIATTSVPLLSRLRSTKDYDQLKIQMSNIIQLLMIIIFPAAAGMAILAGPLYTLFYDYSAFGTTVTQVSALVALVWAFYTVFSNILKAINVVRPMLIILLLGLLLKLVLQYYFVSRLGVYGMLVTTIIAFTAICLAYIWLIYRTVHMDMTLLIKRLFTIAFMTLVMCVVVGAVAYGLNQVWPIEAKRNALLVLLLSVGVGVVVYAYLALKSRLAETIISPELKKLRQKLRIS